MSGMTPEQKEALIQWRLDEGTRGLTNPAVDTESAIELEAYVVGQLEAVA